VTHSGADIAQLLSAHGLRPSRALGQNFVADPNTVRRIARLSGAGQGARVLEIGAGLGSLTLALAETGAQVVAVEADRHLVPVLRSLVEPAGVEVLEGDALTLDLAGLLAARHEGPWSLVANLPYNVATPLVMRTLTTVPAVTHLLVMVQREVGERMAAGPGSSAYGAVSVRIAYFARAEVVGRVPASVFVPRPRVESALVRIDRLPAPAVDSALVSYERFDAVVRAGFSQRRKMLRRSLAGVVDPDAFIRAGVRPDARAEELGVPEWGRLAAL
jgi:16S rRNA (adenine1518-N6/adenine1519-N6)-dimethyltransferase